MKNPNELIEFVPYKLNEIDSLKEYLEGMALKGWKLKNIKKFYYFEKIEPQKLYYTVDIITKPAFLDIDRNDNSNIIIKNHIKTGWKYVCSTVDIVILVTDKDDIKPIEIDERLKYKNIKKSISNRKPFLTLLPLYLLFIYDFDIVLFTTSYFAQISSILILLINIVAFIDYTYFIVWSIKQNIKLKRGEKIRFTAKATLKNLRLRYYIGLALLIVFLLLLSVIGFVIEEGFFIFVSCLGFLSIVLTVLFGIYIQKQKFNRETNIIINVLFGLSISILTLIVSIFIIINNRDKEPLPENIIYSSSTFLASTTTYELVLEDGSDIWVDVFESKHNIIINEYLNSKGKLYSTKVKTSNIYLPEWEALYTFNSGDEYIIVYSNCVISFFSSKPLDEKDIEKIILLKNN